MKRAPDEERHSARPQAVRPSLSQQSKHSIVMVYMHSREGYYSTMTSNFLFCGGRVCVRVCKSSTTPPQTRRDSAIAISRPSIQVVHQGREAFYIPCTIADGFLAACRPRSSHHTPSQPYRELRPGTHLFRGLHERHKIRDKVGPTRRKVDPADDGQSLCELIISSIHSGRCGKQKRKNKIYLLY